MGFFPIRFHRLSNILPFCTVTPILTSLTSSLYSVFLLFRLKLPLPNRAAGRLHMSVQGGGKMSLKEKIYLLPFLQHKLHLFRSHHIYGAFSLNLPKWLCKYIKFWLKEQLLIFISGICSVMFYAHLPAFHFTNQVGFHENYFSVVLMIQI